MKLIRRGERFDNIGFDDFWNTGDIKESPLHKIHAYPAKFPAFITQKAIKYAENEGVHVHDIADIFCGCGTVALEACKSNIDFWGWDINPVAVLIAKAKSKSYNINEIIQIFNRIEIDYKSCLYDFGENTYINERIRHWYNMDVIHELYRLKKCILKNTKEKSKYRMYYLCAFSNILKATSFWLTKSIKPQIDPYKRSNDVFECFIKQCKFMQHAVTIEHMCGHSQVHIQRANSLNIRRKNRIDLIVTSPPYVTSYEYADLHQLSSLWLDFAEDYRQLRKNSVGSRYNVENLKYNELNSIGREIITQLSSIDKYKMRSVCRYFLDMQQAADVSYKLLKRNGLAIFVIGNTEYKEIKINNSEHLVESLYDCGFQKVYVSKRKISGKILTPYRDEKGKFAAHEGIKEVYGEEFVVAGRKIE